MRKNYELAHARSIAGLTQAQAGAIMSVSRGTFNAWESGKLVIPPRKYKAFLEAVHVSPKDIPKNLAPVEPLSAREYDTKGYPKGWRYGVFAFLDEVEIPEGSWISSADDAEVYLLDLIEGDEYDRRARRRFEIVLEQCKYSPEVIAAEMAEYDAEHS